MLQFLYPPTFPKTLLHRPTEPFGGTGTYCAEAAASQSAKEPKIYGFNLKCNNDNECMCAPSALVLERTGGSVRVRVLRAAFRTFRAQHALSFSRPVPVWVFGGMRVCVFFFVLNGTVGFVSSRFGICECENLRISAVRFFSPKQKKIVCANDRLKNVCMGMYKQGRKDWIGFQRMLARHRASKN